MNAFLRIVMITSVVAVGCSSSETTSTPSGAGSCKAACAQMAAAKCSGTTANCESECQNEQVSGCATQRDAYLSCASTATFTCDSTGEAVAKACEAQQQNYVRCFLTGSSDAGADAQCATICKAVEAQKCPADEGTDCPLTCTTTKKFYATSCTAEGAALDNCREKATSWTCTAEGATAVGCESQQSAFRTCLTKPADAGTD